MTVNVPDDFDPMQFDAQITTWIREKPGYDELQRRIKERWPTVPADLINLTLTTMQRRVALESPPPIQLDRELYRIHYKRVKRLKQLEKVLDAGDAPVSMHTLYRGLLRDHETICLKMKASRRQDRLDQLKQEQSTPKNNQPGDPTGWNEYLRQFTKLKVEKDDEEEEHDEPSAPSQRPIPGSFRSMCWLIGFIVATLLAGCVSCAASPILPVNAIPSPLEIRYDTEVSTEEVMPSISSPRKRRKPAPVPSAARQTKPAKAVADHMIFSNISWQQYEQLVDIFSEQHVDLTYDDGRMEMRMPLPEHERAAEIINYIIAFLAHFLDIKFDALGSTTFRSSKLHQGLEPDKCFYLHNLDTIRSKKRLDLAIDPPPDLAIEIEVSSSLIPRIPIYASLGIPELWRYDGEKLTIETLHSAGHYTAAKRSSAFPGITATKLMEWIELGKTQGHSPMLHAVEQWCKTKSKAK